MTFSVAGSMISKRALSEALRHLPPIQRSVGTWASRFSYMVFSPVEALVQRSKCATTRRQSSTNSLCVRSRFASLVRHEQILTSGGPRPQRDRELEDTQT